MPEIKHQVVATSKNDGFSLSSGDFPTLGSDKDNSGKDSDSLGNFMSSLLSGYPIVLCC